MKQVCIALLLLTATLGFAKNKGKDYPLTGTITSFHARQEVAMYDGDGGTYERRVYVMKTDNGNLEITGWERGSKRRNRPPLAIGQTLTFSTDGKFIYTVLDDGKEHRFYIMSAN